MVSSLYSKGLFSLLSHQDDEKYDGGLGSMGRTRWQEAGGKARSCTAQLSHSFAPDLKVI